MTQYLSVLFICLAGGFIQASTGFGFGIFVLIFLPNIYPHGTAVAISQSVSTVSTLFLALRYHKNIRWKVMIPLLIPTVLVGIFFTRFSFSISASNLKLLLGCLLVLLSVYFLVYAEKIAIKPTPLIGVTMGTIAGMGNGLFGIGGPPAVLYLLPSLQDKIQYIATIQAYFCCCNIVNLVVRILGGMIKLEHLPAIGFGWGGVAIGSLTGLLFLNKMQLPFLKKIIYAFVGLNGIWIIIQEIFF